MAHEYTILVNYISYLHDAAEFLVKLSRKTALDAEEMRASLYVPLAVMYHVLETLDVRANDVAAMNNSD